MLMLLAIPLAAQYVLAVLPGAAVVFGVWWYLHHQVPHARTKCVNDFRNDTQGVLSDADLQWAWEHAQQTVATGKWVINALDVDGNPHLPYRYQPADARALKLKPECLGVRGISGTVYHGNAGVTDDSHNIAIDITNSRARNYASYEMENCIGMRLGFPMGNR
jgi:hypothetical protein